MTFTMDSVPLLVPMWPGHHQYLLQFLLILINDYQLFTSLSCPFLPHVSNGDSPWYDQ